MSPDDQALVDAYVDRLARAAAGLPVDQREELLASIAQAREEGKPYDEALAEERSRRSTAANGAAPYYRVYEALDGYVAIACLNNRLRRQVAAVLGVTDPRVTGDQFDAQLLSPEETQALAHQMEDIVRTKTVDEWCAVFDARGVPCGPVRLTAEMFDDPQVHANDLVVTLDHPVVGPIRMANSPIRMSDADTGARMPSPALGQHTRVVLAELGYAADEIDRLEAAGVVRSWRPAEVTRH